MHRSLEKVNDMFCYLFACGPTNEALASGFDVQVHQKFMQMAPTVHWLGSYRDVERVCGHSYEQLRVTRRGSP